MRWILALSVLTSLCGVANAANTQHAHSRHAVTRPHHGDPSGRASGFADASRQHSRAGNPCDRPEIYYGSCQGYAPGEKQQFIDSVLNPY
ncbi:hypothetical protein JQ621_14250 [Bradyrhizobium manausense]|uniref:hypothetical protein n=1 Tax=Bradyrhizobium manausense TaxID=989370 RepID=UPI001BAC218D|nr:hypothetical protein [Bradyrhizobium manausense]MBR1088629.1 hypothetical protein [Bradyrhizobium manausense]